MKVCLTCSHGGHLTQILRLMDALKEHNVFFITYENTRGIDCNKKYEIKNLGRNPLRFLISIPKMFIILLKERPDYIISTGSEIAIPVFYVARILGIKTIFIESFSRVKESSGTGKIVYPVSSVFLVQWEQLLGKYGKKAQYWGSVF